MSLLDLFSSAGPTGFGYSSTADQVVESLDLSGHTVLLTGCNSGIGLESVRSLSRRGARILALARDLPKAQAVVDELGEGHLPVACELSDPASVRAAVQTVRESGLELSALVANAGIMALPQRELLFGIEKQLFTNHVGHFMLVTGLLDQLRPEGRVVILSSAAHRRAPSEGVALDDLAMERGYTAWTAYGQSKLANLLFARELGRRFKAQGQRRIAIAVHPGVIATNLGRHMSSAMQKGWELAAPLVLKSPQQGAATQVFAAAHPAAAGMNGEYLADCNLKLSSRKGKDMDLARRLWERTEEVVAGLPT